MKRHAGTSEQLRAEKHPEPGNGVEDPVLAGYVAEVKEDAATLGVLLHGSRASARPERRPRR
jgi:hypothetical protein